MRPEVAVAGVVASVYHNRMRNQPVSKRVKVAEGVEYQVRARYEGQKWWPEYFDPELARWSSGTSRGFGSQDEALRQAKSDAGQHHHKSLNWNRPTQ